MSSYFAILTFINVITLIMLIIDFSYNTIITHSQRLYLVHAVVIILVLCICEFSTVILDGAPVEWRFLHILTNFLGFSLVPGIYFTLAKAMFPRPEKRFNYFFIVWGGYALWMLICLLLKNGHGIFYVDEQNNYFRGKEFFVFIILYILSCTLFLIENIYISIRLYRRTNSILYINFFFLFFGTVIQVIFPDVHVTWTCATISVVMYYLYYEALYQQIDTQTYLVNYNSLLRWKTHQKKEVVIIIAEIDNYAKLKMNYNREQIDAIIKIVARLFNDYYKSYGRCYRIESDEYCVIIENKDLDFDKLNKNFFISLVKYNFEMADIPLVSLGYATMSPKTELGQALSLAEAKTRAFIKERINFLY